jgi:hypothetical protein
MADLNEIDEQLCATSRWDFSDLRALYINCTLKRSPEVSHTQALGDRSIAIMQRNGVTVDTIRAVDQRIATGVWPDMTEHGWEHDDWPAIHERVDGGRHPRPAVADLARLARMLKDAGGIPAHGNQRTAWDAGCRFDFANPEHR